MHRFVICFHFLFNSIFCLGQEAEFIRLGVNENLSQNSVHHFYQDRQGFMWVATGDGLNRYDGKVFKHYRHQYGDTSARNIPSDFIKGGMIEDRFDNLWFVSGAYITCLNKKTGQFSTIEGSISDIPNATIPLWQIIGIHNDELWYSSTKGTIIRYNIVSKSKKNISLPHFSNQFKINLQKNYITVVFADRVGLYNIYTEEYNPYFIKGKYLIGKLLKCNNFLFVSTTHIDIYSIDGKLVKQISLDDINKKKFPPTDFVEWIDNDIYLSIQEEGLNKINLKTGSVKNYKNEAGNIFSLSNNSIHTLFIDHSQNLWIGTEGGGISKLDLKPRKFFSFPSESQNLLETANLMVKSLYCHDSILYAGTYDKGLFIINTNTSSYKHIRYPKLEAITSPFSINILYKDLEGRLWMNVGNIIGYINTHTGAFIKSQILLRSNFKENHAIFSIHEIAKDHFLLGTNYGLYQMAIKNDEIVINYNQLSKGHIQSIGSLADSTIILGIIDEGFKRVKIKENSSLLIDSGMLGVGIRHIQPQNDSLVWLASDNGVVAYNPDTKKYIVWSELNGLSNSHIYSVLPYRSNELWVSTNKGLNQIKYSITDNNIKIENVIIYQQKDGLQSNEFNSGAYYKNNANEFFFGGVTGINWFNPAMLNTNKFAPKPIITGIDLFDKPYPIDTSINYLHSLKLNHSENSITFHFAALEFSNPKANEFAYMLKGFDKSWVYTSTPEIRYSKLPPGDYTFLLKAANNDGVWSKEPTSLSIIITPPFWKTGWFLLLSILVAISIFWLVIKQIISNRVKKQLRIKELQMAVNEERIRISKDMHDEMGTSLTKISLLSEVTRKTHATPEKQNQLLNEITATSRSLTEKMGEIIWTLNPTNDTLDSLCAYLKEYIYETTEHTAITIETIYPDKIPELKLTHKQRQQLLLVTKEALHNALKHSYATKITFEMNSNAIQTLFRFTDNGKGFELDMQDNNKNNGKGNGILNMQSRMKQINGHYKIESSSTGTIIEYGIKV